MYNEEFWKWVEEHRNEDPSRLRLKMSGKTPWIADAIAQIENERKARKKFQSEGDIEAFLPKLMPVGISIEQATSVSMATIHRNIASKLRPEPKKILDMTCGLGIDASFLATLPESHVTAIEKNEKIAAVATTNYKSRDNIKIIHGDSVEYLQKTLLHFDLIFIDPARRDTAGNRVFNIHDCTPDVAELLPLLKQKSEYTMIKLSPMLDIAQTIKDLPGVNTIYITGDNTECREIIAVIGNHECEDIKINAITGNTSFEFTQKEEATATEKFAVPKEGEWLLEPSAVMMKAGAFKLTGQRYGITALHPNTHVYCSEEFIQNFPGRQSKIIEVMKFTSSNLKRLKREKLEADVAVRNFPYTAEALRSRLGIKKSGSLRIVGVTASDGEQYLLIVRPELPLMA